MPEKTQHAAIHHPAVQMLNETGNGTDAAGGDDKFVCTLANIQALSAEVQGKWDKCKENKGYEEPNKGAARRLLGWVWEPDSKGAKPTAVPKHLPSYYRLKLDEAERHHTLHAKHQQLKMAHRQVLEDNATDAGAGGGDKEEESFEDCEKNAVEKACADIASCEDPVCESYYNEPDVEALCGMCTMAPLGGCFAHDSTVHVDGRDVMMSEVSVGDRVLATGASGDIVSSRVIFTHDHKEASPTLRISYSEGVMELTGDHLVPLASKECGSRYCNDAQLVAAKSVRVGDRIYVSQQGVTVAKEVSSVSRSFSKVRYILTEHDTVVVNGVVASVFSTAAGAVETLPFRLFDVLFAGGLQWAPVAAALEIILESPLLRSMEAVINKVGQLPRVKPAFSSRAAGAAAASSF